MSNPQLKFFLVYHAASEYLSLQEWLLMDIVDFAAGWCREGFSGRNMWGFHYAIHYSDLNLWGIESAQKGAYHKLHGVDVL